MSCNPLIRLYRGYLRVTRFLPPVPRNLFTTLLFLCAAYLVSDTLIGHTGAENNSALVFVLSVMFISLLTNGYFYGLIASLVGAFCINYFFMFPYRAFSLSYSGYPVAMVSMDNCSHNGDKLFGAVEAYAKHWTENGKADKGFYDYICNPETVSFPWSMIDKITPRPDATVKQMLEDSGFEDVETVITSKNTYVATFVNAEEPQYLVIEDKFPNGRPNLDEGGIIYTDRETVDKVEKMKVCTCLNPLHTALAVYGCLLDYTLIYKEMQDPQLKRLVEIIGYEEGLPVVVDPGIIRPKDFIDEVLQKRVTNPFMPDAPQRIATDTSQKLGIRFGETIKAYVARPDLDVKDLKLIPLVLAGWCRYLMGVDDRGEAMELSSDPLLEVVRPYLANVKLGEVRDFHEDLQPILSNDKIFAVNLYEVGLGETVENYFKELVAGPGAVRATLEKYVK